MGDRHTPVTGSSWGLGDAVAPTGTGLETPESERYVSTGLVGAGGMGVVEAVHDQRLDREVARKVAAPGLDEATGLALLTHEARITARLDHPNVVAVHDAGRTPDGRTFFTMRLVRGNTLVELLRAPRGAADLPRLLRHLLDACRALGHAHGLGIVHGDLKPANLLIGPLGETQVADWGLARFLDPAEPAPPTRAGAGTPPWRAPEVEAGGLAGPPADVYALGVVLREILSGDPGREPAQAPVDLTAVLRRATAPAPGHRYPDAAALGEDLERWLDGRPVLAHAYSPREMLTRLVRTWRTPLAIGAIAVAALGLTIGVATARTAAERDRALAAEAAMREVSATLWADRAVAALARDDRPEASAAARAALRLAPSPAATGVLAAFGTPPPATRADSFDLPAGTRWIRLDSDGALCGDGARLTRVAPGGETRSWPVAATDAVWRADGSIAVIAGNKVERLDPATGTRTPLWATTARRGLIDGGQGLMVDRLHVIGLSAGGVSLSPCPGSDTADGTTATPDGSWWTMCSGGRLVRGGPDGRLSRLPEGDEAGRVATVLVQDLAHGRLLGGDLHGVLRILDPDTGATVRQVDTHLDAIHAIDVSPSGALAAVVDDAGRVMLWRPSDGVDLGLLDTTGIRAARWHDDQTLWLAGETLERWTVAPDAAPYRWLEDGGVSAMSLSPTADRVAVGAGTSVLVRRLADGALQVRSDQHERVVKGLAFTESGDRVASGVAAGPDALEWLDPVSGEHAPSTQMDAGIRRLVRASDNRFVAADYGASLHTWRGPTGSARRLKLPSAAIELVASPLEGSVWSLDAAGSLYRADLTTGVVTAVTRTPGARVLALSTDGLRLAVATQRQVEVFELPTLTRVGGWAVHDGLTAMALDAHGDVVATGHGDGQVAVWAAPDGTLTWTAPAHTDLVSQLLFTPDGGLVSGGWDGQVRRWSTP